MYPIKVCFLSCFVAKAFNSNLQSYLFLTDMTEIVKRLGRPNQIRFEMNFYGCQQEAIQTRVTEWRQNTDISGNV